MRLKTERFCIIISPLFFAVITLLLTFSVDVTVIIAVFSSMLHECGHLFMLMRYGCEIRSVTLSFYGMKIIRQNEIGLGLKKETAVCLAGVTVNFLISILFFFLNYFIDSRLVLRISAVNLIMGVFNVLPAFYSDGGRALECLLKERLELEKSEKILFAVSVSVVAAVMISGIVLFIKSGNFTLILCAVYMLVSYILK